MKVATEHDSWRAFEIDLTRALIDTVIGLDWIGLDWILYFLSLNAVPFHLWILIRLANRLVLCVYSFALGLNIVGLVVYHLSLIAANLTTNEEVYLFFP